MRFLLRTTLPFLLALATVGAPAASFAQADASLSITLAPPALPYYAQPVIPGAGYMWAPGYWAWASDGYYWVPGTWVQPPQVGMLWTPGYWGWRDGSYAWNAGYWGSQVGYYGGINYGYGYGGNGYAGGRWQNNAFSYNRAANNLGGVQVANAYSQPIPSAARGSHVSFNGGKGGTRAQPTSQQTAAARGAQHTAPTALQAQHETAAHANPASHVSVNRGRPAIAATQKPGVMEGPGVVSARAAKTPAKARPAAAAARQPERKAGSAAEPAQTRAPKESGNARAPIAAAKPERQQPVRAAAAPKPEPQRPVRAAAARPPERSGSSAPPRAVAAKPAPARAEPEKAAPAEEHHD